MAQRERRVLAEVDPRKINYGALIFDNDAAWSPRVPVVVPESFRTNIVDDWLREAPAALDTTHHATGRLALTRHGVSPTILEPFDERDLIRSVPAGYTTLEVVEKRAVIADGRLARLWTAEFGPTDMVPQWLLLIPDDDGSVVPVSWGVVADRGRDLGYVLLRAITLSRLMSGRAVLVVKVLNTRNWH